MNKILTIIALIACTLGSIISINAQTIRYVKTDGTTPAANAATATSWASACNDLQAVINVSISGDEVWVAAGTYQPGVNEWYIMKEGVKIYGGFSTSGNPTYSERNWQSNITTLQGNGSNVIRNIENFLTATSILDGFTITGGNGFSGSGMQNFSSSPSIINCIFTGNNGILGAGMANNQSSSPVIRNCSFLGNIASAGGGGMHNASNSSPSITNCVFSGNSGPSGGGMFNSSNASPSITNCVFSGNSATSGAGLHIVEASPSITNCVISGNYATADGGALFIVGTSSVSITSCIIYGNSSGIFNFSSNPAITFSLVQGLEATGNNLDGSTDPLFANAPSHTTAPFTGGDYRLQACSPAINSGNTEGYNGNINIDTDLAGNQRLIGPGIDMGPYEFQLLESPFIICPVSQVLLLGSNCEAFLPDYTSLAISETSCPASIVQSPEPGSIISNSGVLTVTLTVTTVTGFISQCSFSIFKIETTFPTITCPPAQSLGLEADCSALLPDYTAQATAFDNCGVQGITQSPLAGTTVSDTGNITLVLTVTDVNELTNTCNFTVAKVDNTPPTITCPNAQALVLYADCSAMLPDYTALAIPHDNCCVQEVAQSPLAGTTVSAAGNMTVTLTVTDVNGLTNTCNFTVSKVDNTPPSITCPDAQIIYLDAECSASLPDYTTLATSDDNCGVQNVVQSPLADIIVSDAGNMTLILTVTDENGLSNSCNFTVMKEDNTPPSIECFNQTINVNGEDSISLDENVLAETDDNCGVQSISLSPDKVSSNQVGQTVPVLVTVTDFNNNTSTCTSQIAVGGLPPGWSQNVNGVGCINGNDIDYNPSTEIWTATSTNCYYSSPFTSDATAFAQRTLCGDGSITAEVTGISGTSLGWAGVVMRENNAGEAKKAQLTTNMAGNQSRREFRVTTNGQAFPQQFPTQNRYWLRIVRSGNQFILYNSPNGNQWFLLGAQTISMNSCIEIGLVATNYNYNSTVTATFANVSYTGNGPLPTMPLQGNESVAAQEQYHPDFILYPNPTSGELNMDLKEYIGKNVQIELYSFEGKLIQLIQVDEILQNTQTMLLDSYASGMYFVRLKSDGMPDVTKRVVLTKS